MIKLKPEQIKYLLNCKNSGFLASFIGRERLELLKIEDEQMEYIEKAMSLNLNICNFFDAGVNGDICVVSDLEKEFKISKSEFYLSDEDVKNIFKISEKNISLVTLIIGMITKE